MSDEELTPVDGIKRAVKGLDHVTINTRVIVPWPVWVAIVLSLTFNSIQATFYIGRMLGHFQPTSATAVPVKGFAGP